MQFVADFYMFIFVEIIMRPRKFNYFGLFSEDMQGYAVFSTANLFIAKVVICCGHVVIAFNRFTAFYLPFKHDQIWAKSVVFGSILSLWGMFIVALLPVIIIYRNSAKLVRMENGILRLLSGEITTYYSYLCRITYVFTVVVCSICYLCSYLKARKSMHRNAVGEIIYAFADFMLRIMRESFPKNKTAICCSESANELSWLPQHFSRSIAVSVAAVVDTPSSIPIDDSGDDYSDKSLEKRLFICAVASSFPFCIEVVRTTLENFSFRRNEDFSSFLAEFGFYEMEAMATVSVWLQLLINKNVRALIVKELIGPKENHGKGTVTSSLHKF
ncbi:hypothetical protein Y032_0308g2051 [Ancylostoma ceylanicum]|uniref:Serpentine receptor class gamma n=1 Tax=Ancylostoma ceylanicum TaxID=53326 RepID=A0A016S2K9_9BILA|nr:hypothetical protein Y032_0308g2051 [Ancylostoma ceylanicum]